MIPRPPRATSNDPPVPYATLVRSDRAAHDLAVHHQVDRVELEHGCAEAEDHHLAPGSQGCHGVLDHGSDTGGVHGVRRATAGELLDPVDRSEEHTSELQSLMRISYAVFCLKKKKHSRIPDHP